MTTPLPASLTQRFWIGKKTGWGAQLHNLGAEILKEDAHLKRLKTRRDMLTFESNELQRQSNAPRA